MGRILRCTILNIFIHFFFFGSSLALIDIVIRISTENKKCEGIQCQEYFGCFFRKILLQKVILLTIGLSKCFMYLTTNKVTGKSLSNASATTKINLSRKMAHLREQRCLKSLGKIVKKKLVDGSTLVNKKKLDYNLHEQGKFIN